MKDGLYYFPNVAVQRSANSKSGVYRREIEIEIELNPSNKDFLDRTNYKTDPYASPGYNREYDLQ